MAKLVETYPCVPSTERGRGILISGHPKKDAFVYTNGRAVIIRSLDRPTEAIVYGEHGYPATVARFSPNGEWVASADVSGTVRIWGVNNDHVLRNEFRVLSGRIDDLQWSPDCERIVASGEGKGKSFIRAFMWDSGTAVGEFDGHSRRVLSCDFKPTRPFRIATCGEDFLVNFYDGPPFKFKLSQRGHSNFVNCIRFSPDGSKFISVSSDKKGILYDGKTGDKIGELSSEDGHNGSIYAVSWSPDSKALLTVSADKTAKIWVIDDQGNGNVKKTLNSTTSSLEGMLVGCLWHRDYLVVVSLGGIISIYSASDLEKPPVSFSGHKKSVNSLAAFQEGPQRIILSSSYDGLIVRWIRGIGYAGRLERADNSQIKSFAVVEGELITTGFDNKVRRIPLEGENCGEAEILDVGAEPKDLSIAQNASELVLLSHDTGIIMLHGSKVVASIKLGFNVTASCISPDGTEAVVGGEDGKLRVYSINGATLTEEAVLEKHRGAVNIIRFSPDGSMFASGDLNREAVVWDRASREVKVKNMLYHTSRINCIAWSPNSMLVATASIDTSVIVYEVDKPATARRTIKGAHLGGVFGLVFNDDTILASSGEDAMIRVWELVPQ